MAVQIGCGTLYTKPERSHDMRQQELTWWNWCGSRSRCRLGRRRGRNISATAATGTAATRGGGGTGLRAGGGSSAICRMKQNEILYTFYAVSRQCSYHNSLDITLVVQAAG